MLLLVVPLTVPLPLLLLLLLLARMLPSTLLLVELSTGFGLIFGRCIRPRWLLLLLRAGMKQARRADTAVPLVQVSQQTPRRLKRFVDGAVGAQGHIDAAREQGCYNQTFL